MVHVNNGFCRNEVDRAEQTHYTVLVNTKPIDQTFSKEDNFPWIFYFHHNSVITDKLDEIWLYSVRLFYFESSKTVMIFHVNPVYATIDFNAMECTVRSIQVDGYLRDQCESRTENHRIYLTESSSLSKTNSNRLRCSKIRNNVCHRRS